MAEYERPKPAPETVRPGEGPMDDEELQSVLDSMLTDAVLFIDGELGPDRAKATDYFLGKPFGNEEDGRSKIVLTEVRDAILGALPSLIRPFHSSEHVVEFKPKGPEDVPQAAQKTDYVNYVYNQDNAGFMLTHSVLHDGLLNRLGVFKWGWEDGDTEAHELKGVTVEQLLTLMTEDESIEITGGEQHEDGTLDISLTRRGDGRCGVWAVPPEEFLFDRNARSIKSAQIVAHRLHKTRGELIAMGIDEETIDAHGGESSDLEDNQEVIARSFDDMGGGEDAEAGKANEKILYVEAYPYLDVDGDGVAELRKVCTIGPSYHVVENEPIDERPFAVYCPVPMPHTMVGQSMADLTMDLQLYKSSLLRGINDSLSLTIYPRTAYQEGLVSAEDMQNTEIGANIRSKAPPAQTIMAITTPFVGKEAMPLVDYVDQIKENRTGQAKGAIGLDADALQSSTSGAVEATVTASQAATEMQARIFAEMTFKPLFIGIAKTLHTHQPRARMVKLRNEWVEVDPRSWDAAMDVTVNVALGTGLVEQKVAVLGFIAQKQEQILQLLGPQNPLVTLKQYRDTLARMAELNGFRDASQFFQPITDEQLKQMAEAQAAAPPPPSPEMILAQAQIQIEQMKAQNDMQIAQQKHQLDAMKTSAELEFQQRKLAADDDRQRDADARDYELRKFEIETKYKVKMQEDAMYAEIERERAHTEAQQGPTE